jgi:hypothetical protein
MKKGFIFILTWFSFFLYADKPLTWEIKKILELGKDDLIFYSITSISEDRNGNFYVLDHKAYKIYKFSPNGKLLLSFGNKGQGPGDMQWPHYIRLTPENRLAVCEEIGYVSFFDTKGNFLNRIRVPKGLVLTYINNSLYYGWEWKRKSKQQLLVNEKGEILKSLFEVSRDLFSVSAPDETGRMVMTSYAVREYTPGFCFSSYNDYSVVAVGDRYEILLLNNKGEVEKRIQRDVKPAKISPKERDYFKKKINSKRSFHDFTKKAFIKKIPEVKNYFADILISEKYIFVFRVKEDVMDEKAFIPVDIFSLRGEYMGTAAFNNEPMLISDQYAYDVKSVDEDLLLVKYSYKILSKLP